MDLRDVFATNLRRLRNAKGMSQDDLAYEAEVSRGYLSQLEKGTLGLAARHKLPAVYPYRFFVEAGCRTAPT
jgi:transcriptional regulator with XRE-family HTH domain